MAAQVQRAAKPGSYSKTQLQVCLGQSGQPIAELTYVKEGAREYSAWAYDASWLASENRFEVSPDVELLIRPKEI